MSKQYLNFVQKLFKYFIFLLFVTRCNFGVDGTGSKYDPYWIEQYEQNMKEMSEKYKK